MWQDLNVATNLSVYKRIFRIVDCDDFTRRFYANEGVPLNASEGYPNDILSKIGEPYLKSYSDINKQKSGLGLGIFIGKNLLEKNFASINCRNSKTRNGAEVIIKWKNEDLNKI